MVSLFLLLGCNLSYIVDLFAALHELASASARTLLKLASSVRALLKPYGDTLNEHGGPRFFSRYLLKNSLIKNIFEEEKKFNSRTISRELP